jgi:hypothetical protein
MSRICGSAGDSWQTKLAMIWVVCGALLKGMSILSYCGIKAVEIWRTALM